MADWPALCKLCETLLRTRSKDLRLAGWLADGWAQQRGLAGLADGLALCTGLVEQHWDHVHPQPEDGDQEQRVGALRWLLARAVALVGLARHAPVVESHHRDAKAAFDGLARLQAAVDPKLGADGPSFMAARDALKALVDDLPAEPEESGLLLPGGAADGNTAPGGSGSAAAAAPGGPLQTRAQALHQLRTVAEFFRRTEPHSPVAYLADKAAKWGAMDLHSWLRTVIKDHGSMAQLEELLGVEPPKT